MVVHPCRTCGAEKSKKGLSFKNKVMRAAHEYNCGENFPCRICGSTKSKARNPFKDEEMRDRHEVSCRLKNPILFPCRICGATRSKGRIIFTCEEIRDRHEVSCKRNNSPTVFPCRICEATKSKAGNTFADKRIRDQHEVTCRRNSPTVISCRVCGATESKAGNEFTNESRNQHEANCRSHNHSNRHRNHSPNEPSSVTDPRRLCSGCHMNYVTSQSHCASCLARSRSTARRPRTRLSRADQQCITYRGVGRRPGYKGIKFIVPLPGLSSVIPRNLLDNVAASSEEAKQKKGWYGASYLKGRYKSAHLEGAGTLTREAAFEDEGTARSFLKDLLTVETAQSISDVRAYDIHEAVIKGGEGPCGTLYRIDCEGLAEKRPSVLRGDRVRVCDNTTEHFDMGFVHFVSLDHVLVSFDIRFQPRGSTFLVIFSMPETNWKKQFLALKEAPLLTAGYVNEHFADCSKRAADLYHHTSQSALTMNPEQQECINRILHPPPPGKHHLVLLHGPPGTGKTTTLAAAIEQLLHKGVVSRDRTQVSRPRILVVTPSNEAANLLFELLVARKAVTSSTKHIRLIAEMYNPEFCPQTVRPYVEKASGTNVGSLMEAELIICTLMVTGTMYTMGLAKGWFSHIAIDEAGQATEAEILVPLLFLDGKSVGGTCVTLAGDHKQLGPVLRSMPSKMLGFGISLLERLMQSCSSSSVQLLDSYRAHPSIMAVYNELTYNNTLRAKANPEQYSILKGTGVFGPSSEDFHPLVFHHVEGKETRDADSPSWRNETEALKVVDLVTKLLQTGKLQFKDVVVLAPYLKQCQVIRDKLHYKFEAGAAPFIKPSWDTYKRKLMPIRVCTVEAFQGREAKAVILSCVRSREASEVPNDHRQSIGFLGQPQRLNVAISRPIAGLFVVGNIGTLMSDHHWTRLVEIFRDSKALVDSYGDMIGDAAFSAIEAQYAVTREELRQHASTWTAAEEVEGEEQAALLDTEWGRVE